MPRRDRASLVLAALALALAALFPPVPLHAAQPRPLEPADGPADQLSLATVETYPWAYHDARSPHAEGFLPAVARELERRTGIALHVTLMPFARLVPELESGRQDCAVFVWTPEAEAYALRGQTVAVHPVGVVPARNVPLHAYAGLRGLTVAVLRGLRLGEPFQSDPAIRKDQDPDYRTALQKLALGRVDAVAGSIPTIRAVARNMEAERLLGEPLVLETLEITLQFSRNSRKTGLHSRLDQALAALRADGTLARMERSFYPG